MILETESEKIEICDDDILHFEVGVYGFEDIKEYVLLSEEEGSSILYMQAVHTKVPSFVLIDPFAIYPDYQPHLSKEDLVYFDVSLESDLRFLVIAAVKENFKDTVVNLKCPVVINPLTKHAKQIILEDADYPIRHKIFDEQQKGI